jgi:hypothetical protein
MIPPMVAVMYLSSSRGGALAAAAGAGALFVLARDRWAVLAASALAAVGAAALVALLSARSELVNGPVGTSAAESQGREAALLMVLVCAGVAVAWALATRLEPAWRPSVLFDKGLLVVCVFAVGFVIGVSDPGARLDAFKETPSAVSFDQENFVGPHLLSGAGSGRWQFWSGALEMWKSAPLVGEGAGSFASWWAQHGSIAYYIQNAHSLYLETLGTLGLVGGLLVALLVATGIVVGGARARAAQGNRHWAIAAATAGFLAWAVGVGVDWMWELTAVTVLGTALLGLAIGASARERPSPRAQRDWQQQGDFAPTVLLLGVAWVILCAQAIPLAARLKVGDSQAAVRRGDLGEALAAANTARKVQPWASSPYLQLALVAEEQGELADARRWIGEALDRDSRDWQLWLTAARIETEAGDIKAGREALRRARELNPRSPVIQELGG